MNNNELIADVIRTREKLENELRFALASMEKTDIIKKIRQQLKDNQQRCPHCETELDGRCPFCFYQFRR